MRTVRLRRCTTRDSRQCRIDSCVVRLLSMRRDRHRGSGGRSGGDRLDHRRRPRLHQRIRVRVRRMRRGTGHEQQDRNERHGRHAGKLDHRPTTPRGKTDGRRSRSGRRVREPLCHRGPHGVRCRHLRIRHRRAHDTLKQLQLGTSLRTTGNPQRDRSGIGRCLRRAARQVMIDDRPGKLFPLAHFRSGSVKVAHVMMTVVVSEATHPLAVMTR